MYVYLFLNINFKTLFLPERLGTGLCLMHFRDFPNISLFPRFLSLMSFGNSWGNSYIKFLILNIKFRFTCDEWRLY